MPDAASLEIDLGELPSWFGMGVAGNFAGHLEQAGEAGDFVNVAAAESAPKGLFPFYAPGHGSFLSVFPLSHDTIALPAGAEAAASLQAEPEVGLACDVRYADDGLVEALAPYALGACNDCSIRVPGAAKISEKKNWGACSKGVAARFIRLDGPDLGQQTASHRLACFLRRDGELHAYGIDSPLSGYSYYGYRLLDWMVERLGNQLGSADTPLEPVGQYLRDCGRPDKLLVTIGATRYTPFGESTFLRPGDESIVLVYDSAVMAPGDVAGTLDRPHDGAFAAASLLVQTVA
ncbi:MAG TPA: DUF5718 family protein [Thermoleophilaceae bacterium]|nr:DUF5718 family protein [Thermoleophilaceae bacterium]